MKTASIRLRLTQENTDIGIVGVTPAELQFLIGMFQPIVQDIPVDMDKHFKETGDVTRDEIDEVARLCSKYNRAKVMKMFDGKNMPTTWEQAVKAGKMYGSSGSGGFLQTSDPISVTQIG